MTDKEVIKQALDALENLKKLPVTQRFLDSKHESAIQACRSALVQKDEQTEKQLRFSHVKCRVCGKQNAGIHECPAQPKQDVSLIDEGKTKQDSEPVAWMSALRNLLSWDKFFDDMRPLVFGDTPQPAPAVPQGWLRVIDEEMVGAHLGIADASDTYEQAKKKLNDLITWHIAVATDPAVNGGFELKPAVQQWQLIETAPTDGTRIICWCGAGVDICYYEHKHGVGMVWMTDSCADFGGYETPTHWMPLPNAPTAQPAPAVQLLTREQIVNAYCKIGGDREWAIGGMLDAIPFAHEIIAEFCRINGIGAPKD